MVIYVNARCADCGAELSDVTGALVIEWPKDIPGYPHPLIYMRCKSRPSCNVRKATQ